MNGSFPMIHLFGSLPSGKRLHSELENHHAINGKIHYFDWAIFHGKMLVHQRLTSLTFQVFHHTNMAGRCEKLWRFRGIFVAGNKASDLFFTGYL